MDTDVSLDCAPDAALTSIPLVDGGKDGTCALLAAEPQRLTALVGSARRHYGGLAMAVGDKLSRRRLVRTDNPYTAEIAAVANYIGRPGAYLLNLSYEWTCTTAVGAGRMLRVLDWPLEGLGANVVVLRREGAAGFYYDVTWPGFAGVVTAMAPGRFSAAINQTPMPLYTSSCWLDWGISRLRGLGRTGLPPAHLLRRAFDTCRTYAEAAAMLTETPIAAGAFFALAGTKPGEGMVIERAPDATVTHASPIAVANDWIGIDRPGRPRGRDSRERRDLLARLAGDAADDFAWLLPPVLNPTTRLAVVADAARGTLVVRGFEARGRATADFRL